MVLGGVFADPDLHLSVLVLADHLFCDTYGPMDGYQSAQSVDSQGYLFSIPLAQPQEAICVYDHLPKVSFAFMIPCLGDGVEVEEPADVGLVGGDAGSEECGFSG